MAYSSAAIAHLLRQWASGNLDNIIPAHVSAGLIGVSVGKGGSLGAMSLVQKYTSDDVSEAIARMAATHRPLAAALLLVYLRGWTVDRLGRVLSHPDNSTTWSLLSIAETLFAEELSYGDKKSTRSAIDSGGPMRSPKAGNSISKLGWESPGASIVPF